MQVLFIFGEQNAIVINFLFGSGSQKLLVSWYTKPQRNNFISVMEVQLTLHEFQWSYKNKNKYTSANYQMAIREIPQLSVNLENFGFLTLDPTKECYTCLSQTNKKQGLRD